MMRLLFVLCLLPLLASGANIDFRNLNTNHFTTNGYKVSLRNFPTNTSPSNYITTVASNYFLTTGGSSSTVALTNAYVSWVFTNGNNSMFVPGRRDLPAATIEHAANSSPAGYTVVVGPGTYAETNNLLRKGVNFEFLGSGSVISSTSGTQTNGIFDDRLIAGGTTNYINAEGWEFTRIFGTGQGDVRSGVLVTGHTNTHIVFKAKKCWFQETDSGGENRAGAFHILAAKHVTVEVQEITEIGAGSVTSFCTPIYWERGEFYLRAGTITSDGSYSIWGSEPAGGTNVNGDNMWITVDKVNCLNSYAIWLQGTNSNYRMWLKGHEIFGGYNAIYMTGGRLYVEDFGKLDVNTPALGATVEVYGGELWLSAQKVSQKDGFWLLCTNGTIHQFEVGHCEDTGSTTNYSSGFELQSGFANISVGKALKRYGQGIVQRSGTNKVTINLSTAGGNVATNWPVDLKGGVLMIQNSTLVAPTATTNSIFSTNAQSIFLFDVNMNTNVNPNVTVTGDYGIIGGLQ